MEDDNQREGSLLEGEPQDVPSSDVSTVQDKQPSFDANALVSALQDSPAFQELLDKRVQSVKDKRFQTLADQIAEVRKVQKKFGWSEEAAIDYLETKNALKEMKAVPQPVGNQVAAPSKFDASEFLTRYGFTMNDPEVVRFIAEKNPQAVNDWTDFVIEKKSVSRATPKESQVMPTADGRSVGSRGLDEVTRDLINAQKEYDRTGSNSARLRVEQLGKEQRELLPRK